MRLAFATDEDNDVVAALVAHLRAAGHEVELRAQGREWPEVGRQVGEAVATGQVDAGVVCCHTGTGVSIAANKVPGVRAALCSDPEIAAGARRWNDANVVALALSRVDAASAAAIVDSFLSTGPEPAARPTIDRLEGG